ncbi:uncharacterized protein LOC132558731 [Ylistrum balloti]|uniref:uncharacterized protein LOC132558731 n=1 Tax=Ylistrum balloti TaxID=509963 RepID=UPI0029058AE2|nr:uncharacterized protein LOC132558731 [Ylistrum balloti]
MNKEPPTTSIIACQILTNEMVCPFKSEYAKIHIWNPSKHLKNGGGRTSYPLQEDTDVSIDGFNIRVKHGNISIRKRPSDCDEEGDYPIQLSGVNNTEITQNKLSVKVKDDSDVMHLDITPFTNASDAKNYTQIVCTGHHQCGTVVVDLQLQIQGFGTYYQPMECSRTNPDGKILDNYGYACTHIMTTEIFNRIENLTCKPTVESLEGTKTHSIAQQSIDVISATRYKFELDQGKPSTLKWNVNIPPLTNISLLQTENNGVIHQNESVQHERVQLFIRIEYHVAKLQVSFNPVTCIDNGTLELHFQNGDKQRKEIEVNGMSTFKACPEYLKVSVGDELKLSFLSCVPDDVSRYTLDLYGIHNRSGFFLRDQAISIDDHSGNFLGYLSLNELSVNYTKRLPITCADHEKAFKMSLQTITGKTIRHFTSLTIVNADRGRYESFTTGGDFREHLPAVVYQRLHLGCRPGNLQLYVNGSFLNGPYRLTEATYSGEKIFNESFTFPNLTMADHGTTVSLHVSFIDDEGSPRYLSSTQEIRVLPDTFCKGRQHGCNFNHPYNANMYVACGEGLIADLLKCPYELVFVESNCEGQCCPQDETTNCRRP